MTHINEKKRDIKMFEWKEPFIRELSEISGLNSISLKIYVIEISRALGISLMRKGAQGIALYPEIPTS